MTERLSAPGIELVRALIEHSSDIVTVLDENGIIRFESPSTERFLGYPPGELTGTSAWDIVHPDDVARVRESLGVRSQASSSLQSIVYRARHRDGSWRQLEAVGSNRLQDPVVAGIVVNSRDVTERARADEATRRLAAIVESSSDAILSRTLDGTILSWNRAAERIYGYTAEEMVGQPVSRLIPPEVAGEEASIASSLVRRERIQELETVRIRKDGERIQVSLSISPILDASGEAVSASIIVRDITEQKRAEAELARSMWQLRAMVDTQQEVAMAGLDLGPVMRQIVERAQSLTSADGAAVEMVEGEEMVYTAACGSVSSSVGMRLRVDSSLSGQCVTSGEILRCDDSEEDPRVDRVACRRLGVRSMLVMPLVAHGSSLGVLKVVACRPGAFDEHAVHSLALLSQLLGAAIADSMAYHNEQALNREIRQAKESAEAASRSKSDFLSGMSHELRTPLNSVIGFTNVLRKNKAGNLREQDLAYLERIRANGMHLLGLINDILDLSKIEAGKMGIELEPVALDSLVRETVSEVQGSALREVELELRMPETLPLMETDARKLKQILINLIGNALKFTEAGSVTVVVEADPVTGRATRIDVVDTGVGIAPERLETIFGAFEQGEGGTARRFGGSGLGLAICTSLAQLLGYRISVQSRIGEGSTFSLFFGPQTSEPLLASVPPPRVPELEATAPENGSREFAHRQVVIIDDDADSRFVLSEAISDWGCEVLTASSGEQGIELARRARPDLITLDLIMPDGMSGWDTLLALKADPDLADIPVVVVSVVAEESRGSLFGAVDLLRKPASREDLQRILRRNLDERPGRVLVVDDDEDARLLIATCARKEGVEIRTASSGREALNVMAGFTPDLIFLDLLMPEMDGVELLGRLREERPDLHPTIVVVTAKSLTSHERERLHGEVARVIEKGGELESALRRELREVWRRQPPGR